MLTCWWKAKDSKSPSCYRHGRDHALPCMYTVLTRYYAPFVYKPPLPFCTNSLRRYIYLQFKRPPPPPPPNHGRTLRLRRTTGRLELTVLPYIECSYLLASDTPTKRLATRRQVHKNLTACLLSAHTFTAYRKCLQHFVLELKENQRFHHLFLLCLANFVYHLISSFVFVLHFVHTVLYFVHFKAKPREI